MDELIHFLEQNLLSCSFKSILGVECPGCGMQRAFIALIKGDVLLSLKMNASLIPFIITLFYTFLHLFIGFAKGARNIIIFFSFTVFVMLVNFVIKLFFLPS